MVYFFSIAAAVLFSFAAFTQHKEAQRTPSSTNLKLSLISKLVKRPIWILGVSLDVLAFLAQFMALKEGSLLLVQPILAFGLTSTLLLEALWGSAKSSLKVVLLSLLSAGALAIFLATTRVPISTSLLGPRVGVALVAVAIGGFFLVKYAVPKLGGRASGVVMGVSVGTLHGIATFVTKVAANAITAHGFLAALSSWPIYSLMVIGMIDLVLTQSAFQSASLSVTMPLINVIEPGVAMVMGYLLLHEVISNRFGYGFLAGILLIMGGISLVISIAASRIVETAEPVA